MLAEQKEPWQLKGWVASHFTEPDETLCSLCFRFGVSLDEMIYINPELARFELTESLPQETMLHVPVRREAWP